MGFNKRYVTRDSIIRTIKNKESLNRLTNADALIMDNWSSKFFKNYDFNFQDYQDIRNKLYDDTKFSSNHASTYEHENFNKLKSTANILYNLYNRKECHWTDILLTIDILGSHDIPESIRGKFDDLRKCCIEKIEKSYCE